jgi:hypothetical protein
MKRSTIGVDRYCRDFCEDVFMGEASFTGPNTVSVEGIEVKFDHAMVGWLVGGKGGWLVGWLVSWLVEGGLVSGYMAGEVRGGAFKAMLPFSLSHI